MHRACIALSQVDAPSCAWSDGGIPSISTACTQTRGCCAQDIHMLVHRSLPLCRARRDPGRPIRAVPALLTRQPGAPSCGGRSGGSVRAWLRRRQLPRSPSLAGAQRALPDAVLLARIRRGPPMYEMEGPRPASPCQPGSCLAGLAPRADRRGQVPVRRTGLPAHPRSRGRPQVVPVSKR